MRLSIVLVASLGVALFGCEGAIGDFASVREETPTGTEGLPVVGLPDSGLQEGPVDAGTGGGGGGGVPVDAGSGGGGGGGDGPVDAGNGGGGNTGGNTGGNNGTGSFTVGLSQSAPSMKLNDSRQVAVTLTANSGFSGNVSLSVEGLPGGVTASFDQTSVDLNGTATVNLTLRSKSDAMPGALNISVVATSGSMSSSAPVMLTLEPELLITIEPGVNIGTTANPNNAAFGATQIPTVYVAPGTKVTFVNKDGINHRIHATGTLGLDHQNGNLLPNGGNSYTETLTGTGTINFNCHIHPGMRGQIVVK